MQLQVMNSPFNQEQAELLNRLLPTLTESQKIWLSGYLSAQSVSAQETAGAPAAAVSAEAVAPAVSKEVTVLYGSQTGNAQGLQKMPASSLNRAVFK